MAEAGVSGASYLNSASLVSLNVFLNIPCYKDGTDVTPTVVDGYTTNAVNFIKIFTPVTSSEVGASQRHTGVAATGYVLDPTSDGHGIHVQDDFTLVQGIEITGWTGSSNEGIRLQADNCTVDGLLVHDAVDATADGIFMTINIGSTTWTFTVQNCIIYDVLRAGIASQPGIGTETHNTNIYNCTVFNCAVTVSNPSSGINADKGGVNGIDVFYDIQNCIVMNNANGDFGGDEGDRTVDWVGNNNIGSDSTMTSVTSFTGSFDERTVTIDSTPGAGDFVIFVDTTNGSEDFHLVSNSDNDAIDAGADLSAIFTDDIDQDTRPSNATYDIGSDEGVPTGVLSSEDLTHVTVIISATGNATLMFTNATAIPANGDVELTFGATFDITGAAFVSGNTGATLTINGQILVLNIGTAITASTSVSLVFSGVKNPALTGSGGTYTILTQDDSENQMDIGTAGANTFIAAPVGGDEAGGTTSIGIYIHI